MILFTSLFARHWSALAPMTHVVGGWKRLTPASLLLLGVLALVACGGSGSAAGTKHAPELDEAACADYALVVGDLPRAQAELPAKLEEMEEGARAWQADADLVALDVGCDLGAFGDCLFGDDLTPRADEESANECVADRAEEAIAWTATYYSPATDASWEFPAREETYYHDEAPLDPALIDFGKLHDWLVAAGYDDGMTLPLGVYVETPTGADGAPAPRFAYSVMVDTTGEGDVKTLLVDPVEGTVTEQAL
jgi:hypothetical protein